MMKKLVVSLFVAMAFATGVHAADKPAQAAPDAATVAAVSRMLSVMDYRGTNERAMLASVQQMELGLSGTLELMINGSPKLNAGQKARALARAKERLPSLNGKLRAFYTDPAIQDAIQARMVLVYARNFTRAEIEQLTAHYSTPLGKKSIALMPTIVAEMAVATQQIVSPRYEKLMQEMLDSLTKE